MDNRLEHKQTSILSGDGRNTDQPIGGDVSINRGKFNKSLLGFPVMVGGQRMSSDNIVDEINSLADSTNVHIHDIESNRSMEHDITPAPWIFVTGGSGYIGSHTCVHLKSTIPNRVMLIDKRSKHMEHTTKYCDMFADEDFTSKVVMQSIRDFSPQCIIHLAASSTIGPGISNPTEYWNNNVTKTIQLLDACVESNVKNFIFASTSSVYADDDNAVSETSLCLPTNTYSRTKHTIEHTLQDYYRAYGLNSISFRFFNAAGAHSFYDLGELKGSSHLLAKIMESIVHNTPFTVFGRDYDTIDGTGLRDYTHVMDIVDAITKGISWLPYNPGSHIINLGAGNGYTVQQVIDSAEKLFNIELSYRYGPRRDGDSAKRYAEISRAEFLLNWKPTRTIEDILNNSIKWYKSNTYTSLTTKGIRAYL